MLVRQILRGLLVPTGHPERPTFVQLENPGSSELSTTQKHLCVLGVTHGALQCHRGGTVFKLCDLKHN